MSSVILNEMDEDNENNDDCKAAIWESDNLALQLDAFIDRLLDSKNKPGKLVSITQPEAEHLCRAVRSIFLSEKVYLMLQAPIKVCGDIHGQFIDLIRMFELCGYPSESNKFLFLGDYVDRGKQSLETISLLFAYKLKFPNYIFLLRGNHESYPVTQMYGFYDECKRRFNNNKTHRIFCDVFNVLPIVAFIDDQVFCCHGGITRDFFTPDFFPEDYQQTLDISTTKSVTQTNNNENLLQALKDKIEITIIRPCEVNESGMLCDLLWADPMSPEEEENTEIMPYDTMAGWSPNIDRNVSYYFSSTVITKFLNKFKLNIMVRAHQVVQDGYLMQANQTFVTVFTAPNYCGQYGNSGGILCLKKIPSESELIEKLEGSFIILRPFKALPPNKIS